MTIRDNLQITGANIQAFAKKYHRSTADIQLLAVSKKHSAQSIQTAFEAGQTSFGENYVQELLEKEEQLKALEIDWHFIGPLQSNKTKKIAQVVSWVHTVDRLKIAKRLSEQRPDNLPPLSICIQVNISAEESKSGVLPKDTVQLAKQILELPRLKLRGLMAIPAPETDFEKQRATFKKVAVLKEKINEELASILENPLDTLSMGMSGDMEAAIAEGATIVRIGTAIFGTR